MARSWIRSCLLTLLLPVSVFSQRFDLDLFGGISNYQGDLQPAIFTFKNSQLAAAAILKYGITDKIYLRGGFSFGSMAGQDVISKDPVLQQRNLSFRSGMQEFHLGVEYRLISPEVFPITPYAYLGIGYFRFNPYAFYNNGGVQQKVFLQPLGTEGQGLAQYPGRERYNLTEWCIPYGGGIKYQINCNLNVGIEFRQTKVFSDYLDDVSTTYADETILRQGNGDLAADLAWRGDEFNGRPYPAEGFRRGDPKNDDWYYFLGLTVGLKINDCETGKFSMGGLFNWLNLGGGGNGSGGVQGRSGKRYRQQTACPRF